MPSSTRISSEQREALYEVVRAFKQVRTARRALSETPATQEAYDDANVAFRQAEVRCIELFPHDQGECACVLGDMGFTVVPNIDDDRCLVLPTRIL